jgi:hypothetical protein
VSDGLLFCLHLRYRSDSDKTTGPTAIAKNLHFAKATFLGFSAIAKAVQGLPDKKFRLCILSLDTGHHLASGFLVYNIDHYYTAIDFSTV